MFTINTAIQVCVFVFVNLTHSEAHLGRDNYKGGIPSGKLAHGQICGCIS